MGVSPTTPTTLAAATDDLTATLAVTKLDSMPPAAAAPSAISATLGGVPGVPFAPQSGALGSRTTLPESESKPSPFSLWKFIKDAAGTNLFTLPLSMGFYLPLTEIQFRAEELEYSSLLDAAAQAAPGSVQRATLVAGFALSHYAATVRLDKPFLPMHGETFDIYLPERGVRVLAETVYTNFKENTINNAWVAHGRGWVLEADDNPIVKLAGASLDFHLNWRDEIVFADGERFCYRKPKSVLGGVVMGTMNLSHTGSICIRSTSGIGCDLNFLGEPGMLSGFLRRGGPPPERHGVRGCFLQKRGEEWIALLNTQLLVGQWDKGLWSHAAGSDAATAVRTPIWTVVGRQGTPNRHDMADFALRLNELTPELEKVLPPTDSRRRPDMRALEGGHFEGAYAAKCAMEAALMARVKAINATGKGRSPPARWFELRSPDAMGALAAGDNLRWRYKGGYWEARASGAWGGEGADIFAAAGEEGEK